MDKTLNENMERFYKSFISVMHFFHNIAVDVSRVSDFSLAQFRVLMVVHHFDSLSVNELKQQLNIAQSSASEIIDRLVQQQMLKREKDPEDKRKTRLILTPRAKKLIQTQRERIKDYYRTILEILDEKDQTRLVDSFEQIQRIVDKYHFTELSS
ncbi:MAG: MarR family transcriptional regulator [Calditrichaeota bacterium]|nr:MarR family transcriptional regulator [Calditrichota bacterium]